MELVDDVAAAVVADATRRYPDVELTTKKLQKLVFYCQAAHLVEHGEPMFGDPIEAWAAGPVVRRLFDGHKGRRVVAAWPSGAADAVSDRAKIVIETVIQQFGRFTAEELGDMTHRERPWRRGRAGLADGAKGDREIPTEEIRDFYSGRQATEHEAAAFARATTRLEGVPLGHEADALVAQVAAGARTADDAVRQLLTARRTSG